MMVNLEVIVDRGKNMAVYLDNNFYELKCLVEKGKLLSGLHEDELFRIVQNLKDAVDITNGILYGAYTRE